MLKEDNLTGCEGIKGCFCFPFKYFHSFFFFDFIQSEKLILRYFSGARRKLCREVNEESETKVV